VPDGSTDRETARVCSVQLIIIDQLKDRLRRRLEWAGMDGTTVDRRGRTLRNSHSSSYRLETQRPRAPGSGESGRTGRKEGRREGEQCR
jgi:hypothetical protein